MFSVVIVKLCVISVEYKYLGILFNYNGRFRRGQLELKEQATINTIGRHRTVRREERYCRKCNDG